VTVDFEEFSHFDADYEKHIKIYLSYVNILQIFTHLLCQRHRGDMKFASHCDVILFDHIFGVTFNSRANVATRCNYWGLAHTALPGLFMCPCHWFIDPEMIGSTYTRHDYSIGVAFCGW